MILNTKHVAVIRAALEYWDDEMSPHPPAVYTAYFTEPIGDGKWIKEAVTELRKQLLACRLRYILCLPDRASVATPLLFEGLDEVPKPYSKDLIATALMRSA